MKTQFVISPASSEEFRSELLNWFKMQTLQLQPPRKRCTQIETAVYYAKMALLEEASRFWSNVKIEEPK